MIATIAVASINHHRLCGKYLKIVYHWFTWVPDQPLKPVVYHLPVSICLHCGRKVDQHFATGLV